MSTVSTIGASRRVARLAQELAATARELAGHCLAADLAVARDDFDVLCDSSEAVRERAARWSALYRELLIARATSGPTSHEA